MKFIVLLVFCVFMGITAISMGVGAVYPPLNGIAKPIVCPNGQMAYQQHVTHPKPGKTVFSASWTCVDSSGRHTPISFISVYAGTFYGLILFAFIAVLLLLKRKKPTARPT